MSRLTEAFGNGAIDDTELIDAFNSLQNMQGNALRATIRKGLNAVKKQTITNLRNYTGVRSREVEQGVTTKVYTKNKKKNTGGVITILGTKGKGNLLRIFNNNKKQQRKGGWSSKSQPRLGSYKRKYGYSELNRGIIKGKPHFFNDAVTQKEQEVFGNLQSYLTESINKINKKQKINN